MASASLRAYQEGEDTQARRRQVVVDYLDTVPLAARPGFGEVHGLGDGLWAWYGRDVREVLEPASRSILDAHPRLHMLFVGRRSDEFAADLAARYDDIRGRVHATGQLPPLEVSAALSACDVLLQPYPDGVTTRRTSVMAGLARGIPTVTTTGALTERVWNETGAAVLAPAHDAAALRDAALRLLADDDARRAQGARGKQVYDQRFSIEHTVDVLTGRTAGATARVS